MTEIARLNSTEELDALLEASRSEPVLLFKHSSACGVSYAAMREIERFAALPLGSATRMAILEIQSVRNLSIEVAERTGIRHESPQVLILRDGEVMWNASHWKITVARLEDAVSALATSQTAEG